MDVAPSSHAPRVRGTAAVRRLAALTGAIALLATALTLSANPDLDRETGAMVNGFANRAVLAHVVAQASWLAIAAMGAATVAAVGGLGLAVGAIEGAVVIAVAAVLTFDGTKQALVGSAALGVAVGAVAGIANGGAVAALARVPAAVTTVVLAIAGQALLASFAPPAYVSLPPIVAKLARVSMGTRLPLVPSAVAGAVLVVVAMAWWRWLHGRHGRVLAYVACGVCAAIAAELRGAYYGAVAWQQGALDGLLAPAAAAMAAVTRLPAVARPIAAALGALVVVLAQRLVQSWWWGTTAEVAAVALSAAAVVAWDVVQARRRA